MVPSDSQAKTSWWGRFFVLTKSNNSTNRLIPKHPIVEKLAEEWWIKTRRHGLFCVKICRMRTTARGINVISMWRGCPNFVLHPRSQRRISHCVRTMRYVAGLKLRYWPYALQYYVSIHNCLPHGARSDSASTICTGKHFDVSLFCVFGCWIYALPVVDHNVKLDVNAHSGIALLDRDRVQHRVYLHQRHQVSLICFCRTWCLERKSDTVVHPQLMECSPWAFPWVARAEESVSILDIVCLQPKVWNNLSNKLSNSIKKYLLRTSTSTST